MHKGRGYADSDLTTLDCARKVAQQLNTGEAQACKTSMGVRMTMPDLV